MSNVTIFSGSNVPAVPDDLADLFGNSPLFKLSRNTGFSSKRISIRGNRFRMEINGEEVGSTEGHIDVVILGVSEDYLRQYYAKAYDPKDTSPPDCWSNDNKVPHEYSAKPQSSSCMKCPQNISGSGTGKTKACQTKANIAVVLANNIEGGEIFEMTIPAKSIFNDFDNNNQCGGLLGYANNLDTRKVDPRRVITRITFDKDSATPLLWFSGKDWVPTENLRTIVQKSESEEAKNALVFHYRKPSDDTTAAPAAAPTPSRSAPTRTSSPAAPTAPAAIAAPAPVVEAPAPAPAPASSSMAQAAALLDEWGEDV